MNYDQMTKEEILIDRLSWSDDDAVILHGKTASLIRSDLTPRPGHKRSYKLTAYIAAWKHWGHELVWVRPFLFEDQLIMSLEDFRKTLFWPFQPEDLDKLPYEEIYSVLSLSSTERRKR